MAKSNFPEKLDTSVEIPAVRDNIVEIGSDVINSIRTAIFQIERTLGINPHGSAGNTVAGRLNRSLDGNGNILKEALDRSGLLSGPITNSDVSKSAGISEKKLRLDFPTGLLQSEISQLDSELKSILQTIDELSVLLSAHTNPFATNRHKGQAITIVSIDDSSSPVGIRSLDTTTSQGAFESIFKSHINYDGSDISSTNSSHDANQIYYNNDETSAFIFASDVQGAIDDVLDQTIGQLDIHQNSMHDNCILRTGTLHSDGDYDFGAKVLEDIAVEFFSSGVSSGADKSVISFLTPVARPGVELGKSDILVLLSGTKTYRYQISEVNYSVDLLSIESVEVFGRILFDSESDTASIYKNRNTESNLSSLLVVAREYESLSGASYSNADIIQIANPNATTLISNLIRPSEISISNRYLKVSVDAGPDIVFDIYDGSASRQTIDTIIKRINQQVSENRLSFSAYRVDYDEGKQTELALAHSMPNTESFTGSLKLSKGSDDGLLSLGFEQVDGKLIETGVGTLYYIQGTAYTGLGTKVVGAGYTLLAGTSAVQSVGGDNFKDLGVVVGDILSIVNSNADDGTYVILDVNEDSLSVDSSQLPVGGWSSESTEDTIFSVYKSSVSLNNMAFRVSPGGASTASVIDLFMDYDRNIHFQERLTYPIVSFGSSESLVSPCDFSGDISKYTESNPGVIIADKESLDPADLTVTLSLDGGPQVKVLSAYSEYIDLYSGIYNISFRVFVKDSDAIASKIVSDGTPFSMEILGYESPNPEENLVFSRVLYEASSSRIAGAGEDYPRPFRKTRFGSIGYKDLGSDVIQNIAQRPYHETRSNGVVRGLEVIEVIDNSISYETSIGAGVCYVKGKRFEIDSIESYVTDVLTGGPPPSVDKFFIAVNEWGEVVFKAADSVTCACPFDVQNYCILGAAEYDGVVISIIDLRLFVDNLDLKLLNAISVSPQDGMGHFKNLNKALKYAKRFSEVFPGAGTPTIHLKSGLHKINVDYESDYGSVTTKSTSDANYQQGVWINFPVTISGEGDSTILDISDSYTDFPISSDDRSTEVGDSKNGNRIWVIGPGVTTFPDGDTGVLDNGFVTIENLRMRMSWISFLDSEVESGGIKRNYGLTIDNVTFDWSENPNFGSHRYGAQLWDRDSSSPCGNVTIKNCQFLNSIIWIGQDAVNCKNISILNNVFRGTGDGIEDGEGHYGIYHNGSGHIFDAELIAPESNINIAGNIIADNDSTSTQSYIDPDGNYEWGDRLSRSLVIPGQIGVGTSVVGPTSHSNPMIHIKADDIGGVRAAGWPSSNALLVLEGDAPSMNILSADNQSGQIRFGNSTASGAGFVKYQNVLDKLQFGTDGSTRAEIGEDGVISSKDFILEDWDASDATEHQSKILFKNNVTSSVNVGRIGYLSSANTDLTIQNISGSVVLTAFGLSGYVYTHDNFGVGTSSPDQKIHIKTNGSFLTIGDPYVPAMMRYEHEALAGVGFSWDIGIDQDYPSTPGGTPPDVDSAHGGRFLFKYEDNATTPAEVKVYMHSGSASVLNFTGQHRSLPSDFSIDEYKSHVGKIVVASGEYLNLPEDDLLTVPTINQALPTVSLSAASCQKNVFGVVSDIEDDSTARSYSIGNIASVFKKEKEDRRLFVNSVGEGGIWICNSEGNFENGDYITTSNIPGIGKRQSDDILHNYTVAKITQDCDFDLNNNRYKCIEFKFDGETYRKAFVGCTYHCG